MRSVIGFDVGGTQIKATALREDGTVMGRWKRPTEDGNSAEGPLFVRTVKDIIAEINLPEMRIGVAAPGLASQDGRSIAFMPERMVQIQGLDWTKALGSIYPVPVLNDAHAALLGEAWCGAAAGCRDVIMLTLGTGVGGAILSDGRLLSGVRNRAGHLGHVCVGNETTRSISGMPGSLEVAVGNGSLPARSNGRFRDTFVLVEAYLRGDEEASEIWLKSVDALARAVASFVNILDPETVIIGGGIARAGDALFKPLNRLMDEYEWRPGNQRVRIVPALLDEWAGAYGAAWKALNL